MGRPDWWPVDKVMLAWFLAMTLLEFACWSRLSDPGILLIGHFIGAALIVLAACYPANRVANIFRYWYPLPYVFFSYKEMSLLIPATGRPSVDQALAHLDFLIWGANPTVWLERLRSPALAELLEIVYSLFVPVVLLPAFLLWRRKRFEEFRYYAFLIAAGFL